jgi:uncharacterized protein (DUF433 family)
MTYEEGGKFERWSTVGKIAERVRSGATEQEIRAAFGLPEHP